ncbi:MAG: hypothetical protein ABIQ44_03545 [Chloroflexia bacterium]
MKKLPFTIVVSLVLLAVGFVIVKFGQSKTEIMAKQATPLPTVLVGFSDIEFIPLYEGATVTFTKTEGTKRNHISYQVGVGMDKIAEFYQAILPKKGWVFIGSRSQRNLYRWTDPEGRLFWHMYLQFNMDLTLDRSKTTVYIEYGRYPNTEEGLPLYVDAQQVSVTRSDIEKSLVGEKTAVRVTDVTYLSSANPQEIADFYINSMQEYGWLNHEPGWSTAAYGWFPFDTTGSWEGISSEEGLYFVASRPTEGDKSGVYTYQLLATATIQEAGKAVVKLHVEEWDDNLGDF